MKGLIFDFRGLRVFVDGKDVGLTLLEFRLLNFFIDRAGTAVTREQVICNVWGDVALASRVVDTHLCSLRKKLGRFGKWFTGVYGFGYRFDLKNEKLFYRGLPPHFEVAAA